MKAKIPTGKPTQKLSDQVDEHDRTLHKELVPFDYNEMLAAIKGKKHTAYHAPDLEEIGKRLQEDRITFRPTWDDPPNTMKAITVKFGKKAVLIKKVPHEACN